MSDPYWSYDDGWIDGYGHESWSDDFRAAFWAANGAPTYEESQEKLLALLKVHAHELAEKIRNDRTVYAFGPPEQEAYADLIDPEVD